MSQALMEHNSLKRKSQLNLRDIRLLSSNPMKKETYLKEVTSAFNISLVMSSFFAIGLSRIYWDALTIEEAIG